MESLLSMDNSEDNSEDLITCHMYGLQKSHGLQGRFVVMEREPLRKHGLRRCNEGKVTKTSGSHTYGMAWAKEEEIITMHLQEG